ncbi:MAG: XRE family transcriptional regulator [Pseudomonadota bacterium]
MVASTSEITSRLAERLKSTRKERGLSLDALSKLSGVSRSMLSQIERGESSPTVAILWNLTQSLHVDFAGLLDGEPAESTIHEVIRSPEVPEITSRESGCRIRILSAPSDVGNMEMYEIEFDPESVMQSAAHRRGSGEELIVLAGRLTVESGGSSVSLSKGDIARYSADVEHSIRAGSKKSRALLVVRGA